MMQALWSAEDIGIAAVLNGGQVPAGPHAGMIVHAIGDQHIALQFIGGGPTWDRLREVMGPESGADDPRFATGDGRRAHWAELRGLIGRWLDRFKSADDALAALSAARVPCAPVRSINEALAHEHLEARGAFTTIPHPGRKDVRVTASPFHVDGAPVPARGPAPYRAGEHTRALLGELLGYPETRIDALLTAGAVAVPR